MLPPPLPRAPPVRPFGARRGSNRSPLPAPPIARRGIQVERNVQHGSRFLQSARLSLSLRASWPFC